MNTVRWNVGGKGAIAQLTQSGWVVQFDSGGFEGPPVLLCAAPWLDQSGAEGALLYV